MYNLGNLCKLDTLCLASLAHKKFPLLLHFKSASSGTPHVASEILCVKFWIRQTSSLTHIVICDQRMHEKKTNGGEAYIMYDVGTQLFTLF